MLKAFILILCEKHWTDFTFYYLASLLFANFICIRNVVFSKSPFIIISHLLSPIHQIPLCPQVPFALSCLQRGRERPTLHLTGVTSMTIGRVYLLEEQNYANGHNWLPLATSGSHAHSLNPWRCWQAKSCAGGRPCRVFTGTAACHRTTVISTRPWAVHGCHCFPSAYMRAQSS